MKQRLILVISLLAAAVPLGILSDASAWGEWEKDYYKKILGFVPEGMRHFGGIDAPLSDYGVSGLGQTAGYYLSAIVGTVAVFAMMMLIGRWMLRKERRNDVER